MATYIKGEGLILSVYVDSVYKPIGCLTGNTLSQTRNILEAQTKCDPGVVIKGSGVMTYELSFEGSYIDTTSVGGDTTKASHDSLKALMDAGSSFTWKLDTGLADTVAYYGTSILSDLSLDAPTDDFASFSGTLNGSGAITSVDPN